MSQQGYRQASVRAVTGTAFTYEGDWHALFDLSSLPQDTFNGRMLRWINLKLTTSYTEINEALQALATANGAFNFSSLGAFDATPGGYTPSLDFSDARNSQYVALLFEDF